MIAQLHRITVGVSLALSAACFAQEPVSAGTASDEVREIVNEVCPEFADEGCAYWSIAIEGAISGDGTTAGPRVSVHHFLADGLEIHASVGVWGHFQDEDDAISVNPSLGFRYHFVREESHTIYADIGVGLLFSDEEVPSGGTRTNFTPRAGVGATFPLGDDGARLDLGVRWHHVSNASTSGTDDNPDRDGVGFYAGVIFPF